MQRTKIEWADYTWNPIKGICPVGCWYCYARRMYQRFGWDPKIILDREELFKPYNIKKPSKIFLCSTFELFCSPKMSVEAKIKSTTITDIPVLHAIFGVIKNNPQHTFQILTKLPQNIDRPMPDNVWLGVTVTMGKDLGRVKDLYDSSARIKFISLEPLLADIEVCTQYAAFEKIDWVIIGRLTGYGKKYDPDLNGVANIVRLCADLKIPVFLKNNLKEIWGEPLIQEFPCVG
ncbi:MAG: DUF5131 family protein [Candidatus Bathyarchaeia archaeon]